MKYCLVDDTTCQVPNVLLVWDSELNVNGRSLDFFLTQG